MPESFAELAKQHHDLEVIYCTKEEEMDALIKKHILEPEIKLVGLSYKSKMMQKAERKKKIVVLSLSTDDVTIVLHMGIMGDIKKWTPSSEAYASLMQNADIRKVGLHVLQIVSILRSEVTNALDCKGVYDLIPMAQRIKAAALKKGKTEHKFPEMASPQTMNKDIWALADIALGTTDFKTPSDVHSARWENEISDSVIAWLSYEPIVARKVHSFLSQLEEEIENTKGPTPLHVTNLPSDVTPAELIEYFKCTSPNPPHIHTAKKNRSTANAAIYYKEETEAKDAMQKYVGTQFCNREVLISETEEGLKQVEQDMQKDRTDFQVYMSNLPYFTTEPQLKRHFRHLEPQIREAKFYCHQDLGVGSVYFKTVEAAHQAVEEFDNAPFFFAVSRYNSNTGEQEVSKKTRLVLLDLDFQQVIRKQKKIDRNRNKGDEEYDALDPYYSHQQRMKLARKTELMRESGEDPVSVGARIDDPAPMKVRMTPEGGAVAKMKTKMRVAGEVPSEPEPAENVSEKVCGRHQLCSLTFLSSLTHHLRRPSRRRRTSWSGSQTRSTSRRHRRQCRHHHHRRGRAQRSRPHPLSPPLLPQHRQRPRSPQQPPSTPHRSSRHICSSCNSSSNNNSSSSSSNNSSSSSSSSSNSHPPTRSSWQTSSVCNSSSYVHTAMFTDTLTSPQFQQQNILLQQQQQQAVLMAMKQAEASGKKPVC